MACRSSVVLQPNTNDCSKNCRRRPGHGGRVPCPDKFATIYTKKPRRFCIAKVGEWFYSLKMSVEMRAAARCRTGTQLPDMSNRMEYNGDEQVRRQSISREPIAGRHRRAGY